ncbi:MAG TPA: hypothetical protein VE984_05175 [Gaiellaceae bacterium]|nr:hypothetical protein [Gaiellaceae bacterium]
MRRIVLSCVCVAVLVLPAAAPAGASALSKPKPGFLVVRKAAGDGGVNGHAVVTLVVNGFVLGRVSGTQQARVDVYHLATARGGGGSQAHGVDMAPPRPVRWHNLPGTEYSGSGFRFRAIGGFYRVVVRGAGVYLFAGGLGQVTLRGSSAYRRKDGWYSVDGAPFRSLPTRSVTRRLGGG